MNLHCRAVPPPFPVRLVGHRHAPYQRKVSPTRRAKAFSTPGQVGPPARKRRSARRVKLSSLYQEILSRPAGKNFVYPPGKLYPPDRKRPSSLLGLKVCSDP